MYEHSTQTQPCVFCATVGGYWKFMKRLAQLDCSTPSQRTDKLVFCSFSKELAVILRPAKAANMATYE